MLAARTIWETLMTEPYKSPQSKLEGPGYPDWSIGKYVIAVLFILVSFTTYYWIYAILPQFMETFSAFGTDLPAATSLINDYRNVFLVLGWLSLTPLLVLFLRKLSHKVKSRLFIWVLVNGIMAVISLIAFLWAMYLPIVRA